jgi:hypothetical protein
MAKFSIAPAPDGTGSPARQSCSEGYYVSYVHINRIVVLYIRNAIAQDWGDHT